MSKTKITLIRGAFLNPFELQNYYPLKSKYKIEAVSSLHPLNENIGLPLIKLLSPTDLHNFPYKYPILNRIFVDAHYLFNLENTITGSDIVHVAETYYHYTNQAIKAKQRGRVKKIISTVWEVIPHNNEGIKGRKQFKELAYQQIDHFLAVTNKAKNALIQEGVNSNKITVIPMGVDIKKFSPDKKKKSKKSIQILFIGRLTNEKGIVELHEAFKKLRKENSKVSLKIVSSLPYSKISGVYKKADIFCLPSKTTKYWQEQFGMVLVEAMASGLPIVTTKTGAIQEVCGDSALYAKEGDSESLYFQLKRLVGHKKLRKTMGRNARLRARENFDSRKIAKRIDAIYQKILLLA